MLGEYEIWGREDELEEEFVHDEESVCPAYIPCEFCDAVYGRSREKAA